MTCPECGSSNYQLFSKKIQNIEAHYSVTLCKDCGYCTDSLAVKETEKLSEKEVATLLSALRSHVGLSRGVFQK